MTREQYEQRKRRLEEQLRAGIQLLESAYQAQVRALDLVWMLQAEEIASEPMAKAAPPSSPASALPSPDEPRRRTAADLEYALRDALPHLPEQFTRGDVCAALGYEPDRGTLFRILRELVQEGCLRLESVGSGRRASVYRRTDG
ncbi:MAG TPA: hypothetical protein VEW48_26805 [Thermoanaerobaculia bacterium]|nr:hypothetical protein [Thermoanaerobaculia bacterium]